MARLKPHVIHVGSARPDIFGRDVAPAERLDEAAVGAQQGLGLPGVRITDDHGLAAAQVQARQAVLVRHRRRQPEGVRDRGVLARVRVEPRATERRTQRRRVDGDDRLQP